MTITIRRRVDNVHVVAKRRGDKWDVEVSKDVPDVEGPVTPEEREKALRTVLGELSSLRAHIWHEELKQP